jgi:hypothetical protein
VLVGRERPGDLVIAWALAVVALTGDVPERAHQRALPRREILQAMRESHGYDMTVTTNGARFQAEVLRRLVRRARASDPSESPLFIGHRDWFQAYLERTGLSAEAAPAFVRLSDEYGQDMTVDYRREKVVGGNAGPPPELAMNVCIWWPEAPGRPGKYSYEDLLSKPRLKVTNERVISYRLMDFGDMTVFDDIKGLRGRPTSGVLGFLFQLIGEGRVVESRMAIAGDGVQVARARARKALFEVVSTVTVYPDGHAEKDVPPGRPDLAGLEARLKQPLKLPHPSVDCGGAP